MLRRGPAETTEPGPTLDTPRLRLVPVRERDVEELHALLTDAEVRRYLLDDDVVDEAWVSEEVESSRARFRELGCGLWAAYEAGEDSIAGLVGFRHFFDPPELQLLFAFLPSRWGRGLATEAARAAMRHAFDELGLDEVRAATDVPNGRSVRVLERLGMVEHARTAEGPAGTIFFRADRAGFERAGSA